MKKYLSRKFILMTLLFIISNYFKYKGIVGDTAWLIGSGLGVWGYAFANLWMAHIRKGQTND